MSYNQTEIWGILDAVVSKHFFFFFFVLLLSLRSSIYDIHTKWPTNDPLTSTIRKNEQYIYCSKKRNPQTVDKL